MSAITRIADLVAETVNAPSGTGAFAISSTGKWQIVSGLPGAYQTFANIPSITGSDRVFVRAYDSFGNNEVDYATYNIGALARTSIINSTSGGSACTFSGTVTVMLVAPQEMAWPVPQIISTGTSATGDARTQTIIFNSSTASGKTVSTSANWPGQILTVKDGKGDAATNTIVFTPAVGVVDGQASYTLDIAYGSVSFTFDGSNYWIAP